MYFKNDFLIQRPLCFLFFACQRELLENGVVAYMRKKYPDAKFVCYYQDLAALPHMYNVDEVRSLFDLMLSFDLNDCTQYGLTYYPLVYSSVPKAELQSDLPESDVYFAGKAKNRLPEILSVYKKLRDAGLKCDFHIAEVAPHDQKYRGEIDYSEYVPYRENLKHVYKTKCLLEIMQQRGSGYTLRVCEAIALGRKLLSNNQNLITAPFYRPEHISVFREMGDLDIGFIDSGPTEVTYHYLEQLSPINLLGFIETHFSTPSGKEKGANAG